MNERDKLIVLLSAIGSLICLNMLSLQNFWRLDLTSSGAYTLSEASTKTMGELEDPVTVTAYFTEDLPPPFSTNAQFVRDLLEEYRAASKGMVSFEFIDPQGAETEEDKELKKDVKVDIFGQRIREMTSIEKELEQLGIATLDLKVIEDDAQKSKRAYMGLVNRYGEEQDVMAVVESVGNLEYELTTRIRNLTRTRIPVVGIVQGHDEPTLEEGLKGLQSVLQQVYEVRPLDLKTALKDKEEIDADFNALIIVSPKSAFTDKELKAVDAFIQSGKSAAFFLDRANVDLQTGAVTEVDHGLGDLLASYGVEMGGQLVADADCASLPVMRRMGKMQVQMPVRYPFIPVLKKLEGDSPIVRGLTGVWFPFLTPVYLSDEAKAEGGATKGTVLARSGERSWLEDATQQNVGLQRFLGRIEASFTGPYDVMVSLEGELTSPYGAGADESGEKEGAGGAAPKTSRVLVSGSGGLVQDMFMRQPNAVLAANIVDWLVLDPALLSMRTRGMVEPPLAELSDGVRGVVKWGNAVGVPLLLLFYGFIRWQTREARRRRLNQQPV
jgi:gliding-associated putative ABC transporter substrate-binding component GldG